MHQKLTHSTIEHKVLQPCFFSAPSSFNPLPSSYPLSSPLSFFLSSHLFFCRFPLLSSSSLLSPPLLLFPLLFSPLLSFPLLSSSLLRSNGSIHESCRNGHGARGARAASGRGWGRVRGWGQYVSAGQVELTASAQRVGACRSVTDGSSLYGTARRGKRHWQ